MIRSRGGTCKCRPRKCKIELQLRKKVFDSNLSKMFCKILDLKLCGISDRHLFSPSQLTLCVRREWVFKKVQNPNYNIYFYRFVLFISLIPEKLSSCTVNSWVFQHTDQPAILRSHVMLEHMKRKIEICEVPFERIVSTFFPFWNTWYDMSTY